MIEREKEKEEEKKERKRTQGEERQRRRLAEMSVELALADERLLDFDCDVLDTLTTRPELLRVI